MNCFPLFVSSSRKQSYSLSEVRGKSGEANNPRELLTQGSQSWGQARNARSGKMQLNSFSAFLCSPEIGELLLPEGLFHSRIIIIQRRGGDFTTLMPLMC